VATCQTDDLGEYRLAGLPAGRFFVSVDSIAPAIGEAGTVLNESHDGSLTTLRIGGPVTDVVRRQMQTRVYYPGVQTLGDAVPVALTAGEERPAVDFSVLARKPIALTGGVGSIVIARGVSLWYGTGVIRGRVVAGDGQVLPDTIVRLEMDAPGSIGYPAAVTDAQGRFEFQRLGLRTYTVTATRAGFLTTAYGQRRPTDAVAPIALQPGERRENVDIALSRPSAIVGRVLDDAGEPVESAYVRVLHIQYRGGRRRLVDAGGQGTHRTDDRGAYRLYGLPPDEYVVGASVGQVVSGQPVADRPGFSTSYHPGTANPQEAKRIPVDLAQDVSGVDVMLVTSPTVRISGIILDATGRPLDDGLILTPRRTSGALVADPIGARIDPDGRFEFRNVTLGEYVIQASKGGDNPNDEGEFASQFVTVGNTDITGVTIRLSRGSKLTGRITLEGNASAASYFALNLQAVPADVDRTPQNLETPASARIQEDGAFDMAGLSGPRVLRLTESTDWTLKAVLFNGRDVTDTPLPFGTPNQSIDGLEVVLTDRVSEVTGHAVDARGRAVADATAVIFSTDRALWGEPSRWGETSRFVVSAPIGNDGGFSVRHLPPGYYYAAAVTQVAPGEWRNPDLLDALVPSATPITIIEGDIVTTTLRAVTR
jgi:Carboxypeptidase regulatory-like domain